MPAAVSSPLSVVVLISGRGSNLRAILDAVAKEQLPVQVRAVISNRPDALGLAYAAAEGIPTEVVEHDKFSNREEFDWTLQTTIDKFSPQLVVLAGFMRLLTRSFVEHYLGRLINIHPSLLPAYKGLNTHRRAIADGAIMHGASVHFVTPELDGGPVILQAEVPVLANDDAASLSSRVLLQEHVIFPMALKWFAEQRLKLKDKHVYLDNKPLTQPLRLQSNGQLSSPVFL